MPPDPALRAAPSPARAGLEVFLVSALALFLELACIRWFPAQVLFLTFFTNTVLLASFLGLSVGCLIARGARRWIVGTPFVLLVAMGAALALDEFRQSWQVAITIGTPTPEMIFFGAEKANADLAKFAIPIELIGGFFFLAIAAAFVGPGQELGAAFDRLPDRVRSYTLNILGSLVGIVVFAGGSLLELGPVVWFGVAGVGLAWLVLSRPAHGGLARAAALAAMAGVVGLASIVHDRPGKTESEHVWSRYYRIDYDLNADRAQPLREILTNLIGHQVMHGRDEIPAANDLYAMPHSLARDSGSAPFGDVLIIGAGSGNDVSRALAWGARHVDAVEIDPVIERLGRAHHPDRPYDDPRVNVIVGDGRNFLRATDRTYDLIIYALVDSLVLHSSFSNIRLESYLMTRQAFEDVRAHLRPGGVFCMYNWFRQGWLVARIRDELGTAFGRVPLVVAFPYAEKIGFEPRAGLTMFLTGATERIEAALAAGPYLLPADRPASPTSTSGFVRPAGGAYARVGLAEIEQPRATMDEHGVAHEPPPLLEATDDWPFLYLRAPMIPQLTIRGMSIMIAIALLLLYFAVPRRTGASAGAPFDPRMFFLGAGFMLVETKAVVHMALLFGSTWMVNTVVFCAVLVMILGANLFVLAARPRRLTVYYVALFAALALDVAVPLDAFLGWPRALQLVASCALAFAPILFAGVIFAASFERAGEPDRALGTNIAGSMLGGFAENASMLLGFRRLLLVAIVFYAASMWRRGGDEPKT